MRRLLLIVCLFAAVWAVVVVASGGFVLRLGSVRVLSSREPWNALIMAVLSGLAGWALTPKAERRRLMSLAVTWVRQLPRALYGVVVRSLPVRLVRQVPTRAAPAAAAAAATAVVIVGILEGAPYVGGSDVYGYVSQSELWAAGRLRVEQPLVGEVDWPFAADALTPLGYRPSQDRTMMVPIYAPGYPMLMAIFQRLAGRDAVFYVVPLLGGLAVWATYLMGARLAGTMVGVSAAVLLATSPSFLFQLLLPMSDVPVTAWWALSLALMLREGSRAALLSGLAAGAAILTRPNLVPLAVVPGLLLLLPAFRDRAFSGPSARRVLLFAVGVVPPCLFIALLNATFYGSPVAAGYGPFEALYAWKNLVPNLQRYPSWLLRTQTPVVLFAIVAPFVVFRMNRAWVAGLRPMTIALAWLGFIALVFLAYLFHTVNNTWFWLRYVLPGFPALFVLTGVALASLLITLDRGLRLITMGLVVGALAWQGVAFAVTDGVFRFREGERKSLAIGQHIAAHFPERAVFVSLQHSGSVRYYSGRLTVRFDLIPPEALDTVIEDLRRRDYRPYILLEEWEERTFRNRFAPHSGVGRLDWPEAVRLEHLTQVRIYDPADRNTPLADRPPTNVIR